jgi:hypothetical protein
MSWACLKRAALCGLVYGKKKRDGILRAPGGAIFSQRICLSQIRRTTKPCGTELCPAMRKYHNNFLITSLAISQRHCCATCMVVASQSMSSPGSVLRFRPLSVKFADPIRQRLLSTMMHLACMLTRDFGAQVRGS